MSTGVQHARASRVLAQSIISTGVLITLYNETPNELPYLTAGLFGFIGATLGLFLTPDMDVDGGNITYIRMKKIGLRWWWSWLWRAYSSGIKHRSFISHFPIVGTLYRFVYMAFPCTINLVANQDTNRVKLFFISLWSQLAATPILVIFAMCAMYIWYGESWIYFAYVFCGIAASDALHFVMDT